MDFFYGGGREEIWKGRKKKKRRSLPLFFRADDDRRSVPLPSCFAWRRSREKGGETAAEKGAAAVAINRWVYKTDDSTYFASPCPPIRRVRRERGKTKNGKNQKRFTGRTSGIDRKSNTVRRSKIVLHHRQLRTIRAKNDGKRRISFFAMRANFIGATWPHKKKLRE